MARTGVVGAVAAIGLAFAVSQADAVTYGFGGITGNSAVDTAIGEAQLFVDVTDAGGGRVSFYFYNTGPAASSITDIYFDDGSLLAIASLIDSDDGVGGSAGVDFSTGASPPDLPGGNTASPPFVTTAGFLADSDAPVSSNGINPDEYLYIIFSLQGSQTFNDVINELAAATLRIGIHVQAFASGGSESFINGPTPVPLPAALPLFATALAGGGLLSWRRRRKAA